VSGAVGDSSPNSAAVAAAQNAGRDEAIAVCSEDLPLHCPPPGDSLWNAHPRVYLPLQPGVEARCPYCGARYLLQSAR